MARKRKKRKKKRSNESGRRSVDVSENVRTGTYPLSHCTEE